MNARIRININALLIRNIATICLVLAVAASGCRHEHGHTPDAHSHGGHDHTEQIEALSYTIRTDKTELFVEFSPLVTGQFSAFAAHFSSMQDFKALEEGVVTVSLIKGGRGIRHSVDAPSSPGIFRPALRPKEAGLYRLVFEIQSRTITDRIVIDSVSVYGSIEAAMAANPAQPAGDDIAFLKEQAWKIDFAIGQAERRDIYQVIKTGGTIEAMQGEEMVITAKTSGIVFFGDAQPLIGKRTNAHEVLFSISGEGITDSNIESRYAVAKAEYDKALAAYERGNELLQQSVIAPQDFDEIKARFEIAKTDYENIAANYSNGGQQIKAPFTGYVTNILVNEGQYVQSGAPLAMLSTNKRLILQAEVSQKHFADVALIRSANFKTAYSPQTYNIEDYNGRLLSYAKNAVGQANYLPVLFEIDNKGELLPGSFVEVFLKTTPVTDAIVVPVSAIMEDYEHHYVYVQTGGESFEKRDVQLGVNDGVSVQVVSGVQPGEWVVTKGAYQVKMASMATAIPAHGHSH